MSLCGEEKAPFPIKAEDAEAGLKTEYLQVVPGCKDVEGRQARVSWDIVFSSVAICLGQHCFWPFFSLCCLGYFS